MNLIHFSNGRQRLAGNWLPMDEARLTVLFLHGGGTSSKAYYHEWQTALGGGNISSLAIDFTGVGDSEGEFERGTLRQRMDDALAAVDWLMANGFTKIVVAGSSMGGYVATRIVNRRPAITGLILHSPAAYGKEAEGKLLNHELRTALRVPNSFDNSPAFLDIYNFPGQIFLSYGEHEERIPTFIQEKYKEIVGAKGGVIEIILGAFHKQLDPEVVSDKVRQEVFAKSIAFLHRNFSGL